MQLDLHHETLRLGLVRAEGVRAAPSDLELLAQMQRVEERLREEPTRFSESVRASIRDLLRVGGYKPTGRGKPASELLLALALKEGLPRINNLVDVNNLASLESALPISMFDADLLGDDASLRFGRAGERYLFNNAGHAMELEGLPVVCRDGGREPVGNAVRDSMACKVRAETTRVLAVVYGSSTLPEALLRDTCERLASLLRAHAHAGELGCTLLP